jgi:hypothetical protein
MSTRRALAALGAALLLFPFLFVNPAVGATVDPAAAENPTANTLRTIRSVPATIAFQGFLTDSTGTPVSDPIATLDVAIYDVPEDGTALWSEVHTWVPVSDGVFQIALGSEITLAQSIFTGDPLYVGIAVNGEAELPRTELHSAPFAFRAAVATVAESTIGLPAGIIAMWSGTEATIPSGWALCDGSNGTPDLRNRFIYGTTTGEDPGGTGGSTSLPSHTHQIGARTWTTDSPTETPQIVAGGLGPLVSTPAHSHSVTVGSHSTYSAGAATVVPPYYRLAFIMKL